MRVAKAKQQILAPWQGPYDGVPAFDKVSIIGLMPAFEEAMALNLAEIDVIANNEAAAIFENTIVALERTGKVLDRAYRYRGIWSSNISPPEFREIQAKLAPKLSAFYSKINQNEKLFNRISAIYNGSDMATYEVINNV